MASSSKSGSSSTTALAVAATAAAAALAIGFYAFNKGASTEKSAKEDSKGSSSSSSAAAAAASEKKDTKSAFPPKVEGNISTIDPHGWLDDAKQVNISMYADNRRRLLARFAALRKKKQCRCNEPGEAVVLEGGHAAYRYDTDVEYVFRQESNFSYLFAIPEPECFGALNLETGKTLLFIPRLDPVLYAVWSGPVKATAWYRDKYGVDECYYTDQIADVLKKQGISRLHTLDRQTHIRSAIPEVKFKGIEKFEVTTSVLSPEIVACRAIKSAAEIQLMRYINQVSSDAHITVMQQAHTCKSEHELESIFLYETYRGARCRHVSYTCICCSGHNSAILHYGHAGAPNDKHIQSGDMLLLDMGAEYFGYASDITCSFPANGKFTKEQKIIFEAVADSQAQGIALCKPGVSTATIADKCDEVLVEHLIKHDFIRKPAGVTMEDLLVKHRLPRLFMPHGFGHLLGLDVHDVGGFFSRRPRALEPGVVLTVEPGIYFVPAKFEPAFKDPVLSKLLNADKIRDHYNFGGVRLEDDIVVTANGPENLTRCPRTVAEVEAVMARAHRSK